MNTGEGRDALGNQWETALWLVNTLIENGWTLAVGQFFITGALGQMIPCQVGNYQTDFGKLGRISFSVVP